LLAEWLVETLADRLDEEEALLDLESELLPLEFLLLLDSLFDKAP